MDNDIVSRIKKIMEYKSLNSLSLAKKLGYKSSEKLSRLFRDNKNAAKPSYDIIYDISNMFDINIDWLITGRGEMLKQDIPIEKEKEVYTTDASLFLDRIEKLSAENALLKRENEKLKELNKKTGRSSDIPLSMVAEPEEIIYKSRAKETK